MPGNLCFLVVDRLWFNATLYCGFNSYGHMHQRGLTLIPEVDKAIAEVVLRF